MDCVTCLAKLGCNPLFSPSNSRKPRRIPKSHSSEHFLTPRHFPGSSPGKLKSLSSHTELTPPPLPLTPMKVATPMTNLKHGPNRLPGGSLDLDAQTPRTDVDRDVTTPTNFMPLTKKKWLESSDPGLFGVTSKYGLTYVACAVGGIVALYSCHSLVIQCLNHVTAIACCESEGKNTDIFSPP